MELWSLCLLSKHRQGLQRQMDRGYSQLFSWLGRKHKSPWEILYLKELNHKMIRFHRWFLRFHMPLKHLFIHMYPLVLLIYCCSTSYYSISTLHPLQSSRCSPIPASYRVTRQSQLEPPKVTGKTCGPAKCLVNPAVTNPSCPPAWSHCAAAWKGRGSKKYT